MRPRKLPRSAVLLLWLVSGGVLVAESVPLPGPKTSDPRVFAVRGVVMAMEADPPRVVVRHGAIPGYMDAMTMPFNVREPKELQDLRVGDEIAFCLNVTETNSWIDHLVKLGTARNPDDKTKTPDPPSPGSASVAPAHHPLLDFKFTNERGQAVSLSDFRGQALAITFFFTRCPIPDFCPRLSKNFQEASQKLGSLPGGPTNWHFLSFSFDPAFDTPPVLKAYAERYQYNPAHWSFLTGPADKINELARLSGVEIDPDAGLFNHNFRTMIIGADGQLRTTFPFGGNLSDPIVNEMLKAAAATNRSGTNTASGGPPRSTVPIASGGVRETDPR